MTGRRLIHPVYHCEAAECSEAKAAIRSPGYSCSLYPVPCTRSGGRRIGAPTDFSLMPNAFSLLPNAYSLNPYAVLLRFLSGILDSSAPQVAPRAAPISTSPSISPTEKVLPPSST